MRLIYFFTILLFSTSGVYATKIDSLTAAKAVSSDAEDASEDVDAKVYSLEIVAFENGQIPVNSSLYKFHTSTLEFVIPMDYNSYVKNQIDFFGVSWQTRLKEVITRSEYYFPIYEEILDKHEMPLELKYLSVIESALNPMARSHAGAVGPWQFMPSTGRLFDLDQNYLVDERRSVEKSTEAAAKYLKSMYEMFGDWYVAIASYNCGPGNVRKAIRRSGKKDFWGMYHYLPRETRNYVPKFIAVAYIMNFYDEFGITPAPLESAPQPYHPVYCHDNMSFSMICEMLGMTPKELKSYNPELKGEAIPQASSGYWLNVPEDKVPHFYVLETEIIQCSIEEDLAQKEIEAAKPKVVYHTVRKGECLPVIARKYGCTVTQLKSWNNLRGSLIYPNQRLKIERT